MLGHRGNQRTCSATPLLAVRLCAAASSLSARSNSDQVCLIQGLRGEAER